MAKFKLLRGAAKQSRINKLQELRDATWKDFCRLPRRDSFSGLHLAGKLNSIQQELDFLGDDSKRYLAEINIEIC